MTGLGFVVWKLTEVEAPGMAAATDRPTAGGLPLPVTPSTCAVPAAPASPSSGSMGGGGGGVGKSSPSSYAVAEVDSAEGRRSPGRLCSDGWTSAGRDPGGV